MKEQEGYFFEPQSLTRRKKQTRQDIKICRHSFFCLQSAVCILRSVVSLQMSDTAPVIFFQLITTQEVLQKIPLWIFLCCTPRGTMKTAFLTPKRYKHLFLSYYIRVAPPPPPPLPQYSYYLSVRP